MNLAAPSSARARLGPYLVLLCFLPLCVLLGMTIALGSTQLSLLAVGGVAGILLLFVPSSWILTGLLVLSFVVVGLAMYYFKLNQAAWLPYALCLFLWAKLPLDRLTSAAPVAPGPSQNPPFLVALYLFFAACILSSIVNQTPFINALVGAKNFIFIWSVAFLIASVSQSYQRSAWLCVLWLAILQAPFAVAQHFGVGTGFRIGPAWDAIVGTFGGDPLGAGGGSGSMAIFLSIAIGLAVAFLKYRAASPLLCWVTIVASFAAVLMAEIKVFFLLLPLMLLVVLGRGAGRRPLMTAGFALMTVAGLAAIGTYYSRTYYEAANVIGRNADASSYYEYLFGIESDPQFVNKRTGEVSRIGAPLLWLKRTGEGATGSHLFGYGMSASRASETIGYGAAARRFPFQLTTSSLTVLLWDTGALGTLAFLAMLVLVALRSWSLSQRTELEPFDRACLEASTGAFVIGIASIPYNNALVDGPSLQIFFAFVFGYVLWWHRRMAQTAQMSSRAAT